MAFTHVASRVQTAVARMGDSLGMPGRTAFPLFGRSAAILFVAALIVVGSLLNACAVAEPSTHAPDPRSTTRAAESGSADQPGAGIRDFLGNAIPNPEATITPAQNSWDAAPVPAGLMATVISADHDSGTLVLLDAVRAWGAEHQARVTVLDASSAEAMTAAFTDALVESPDIVIGVGSGVVDVFALETAQFLDQQFLVLGAQLAEPTENVTAVIWPGASFRGTGISEADADADADAAVTAERARDAVAAGVAAMIWDLGGIVIQLP